MCIRDRVCPNLPALINNVFDIYVDFATNEKVLLPHPIKPMENEIGNDLEVYVDLTEDGTWFALSNDHFPSLVNTAPTSKFSLNRRWRHPNIFQDAELIKTAMIGVHHLSTQKYRKVLINDEEYNSDAVLPSIIEDQYTMNLPETYHKSLSKGIERYISPQDIYEYKLKIQEELERSIAEKNNTLSYKISRFIIRVLESGFMLVTAMLTK